MFISRAYGGRASDKFIFQDSKICLVMNLWQIENSQLCLLFNIRACMNIPAYTNKGAQLSEEDVTITRRSTNTYWKSNTKTQNFESNYLNFPGLKLKG